MLTWKKTRTSITIIIIIIIISEVILSFVFVNGSMKIMQWWHVGKV